MLSEQAVRELQRRLPPGWKVGAPRAAPAPLGAVIKLSAADARAQQLAVLARDRLDPRDVEPLIETSQQAGYEITIYDAWCKKCGICVEFCPKGVLTSDQLGTPFASFPEKCIGCTQCVLHCPDFAITVSVNERPSREPEEQHE